jgi:hypothetical protein
MASFTVRQGKRYRAILSLGFLERLASNEMVAKKLSEAGFTDVTVSGNGASRVAEGVWPAADATADMPPQVINVIACDLFQLTRLRRRDLSSLSAGLNRILWDPLTR